jgi:hypothetical protein
LPIQRIHNKALSIIPEGSIALAMQPEYNGREFQVRKLLYIFIAALAVGLVFLSKARRD